MKNQASSITEKTLDNGFRVVVVENHRAPVAIAQVWYRVGSADEHAGITGLSHALEHMMFLGTKELPGDQFAKVIGNLGGYENAYTSEDQTVYYEEISRDHLETCLKLEADRMKNLQFNPDEVMRELDVIKEERRLRVDDEPHGQLWERFLAAANPGGPYQNPIIGWMEDIDQITLSDLKAWYAHWYAPNHAMLVVVGDVKPDEVFAWAQTYFGEIPASTIEEPLHQKSRPIIASTGKRTVEVHANAQLPYLMIGFDVPSLSAQSIPASLKNQLPLDQQKIVYTLLVLQGILDGGLSARFEKNLIRDKAIASEVSVIYDPFQRYQTQFIVAGTPSETHDIKSLEKAIMAELTELQKKQVTEKELKRTQTNLIASFVYDEDSLTAQANHIGKLAQLGLPLDTLTQFEHNIQAVSAKDIKTVANAFLTTQRQSTGILIPQGAT